MKYTPEYYAQFLYTTKDPERLTALLERHWVISWLDKIVEHYETLLRKRAKKAVVNIASARPLSPEAVEDIERLLSKYQPDTTLEFTFEIDKNLLGGFNVQSQDIIIQGSLKDQLNRLLM